LGDADLPPISAFRNGALPREFAVSLTEANRGGGDDGHDVAEWSGPAKPAALRHAAVRPDALRRPRARARARKNGFALRGNLRETVAAPQKGRGADDRAGEASAPAHERPTSAARGNSRFMTSSRLLANLPNLITVARLLMTPLAVSMIVAQRFAEAFVIFVLAGVSDAVDGFIAKRFDLRSELGSYLDPLADKALLISMYVILAAIGALTPALAILVVSRDLMILFAVLVSWLLAKPVAIRPVWISKFNTAAQISLAGFVLGSKAYGYDVAVVQQGLALIVAASTLASGGVYIAQWLDHMSR
jgi:cardiolipin synthase